jgi:sterol desaturase/sphingolipid hydroxylase (fatty acid hydroxylase superfamily)
MPTARLANTAAGWRTMSAAVFARRNSVTVCLGPWIVLGQQTIIAMRTHQPTGNERSLLLAVRAKSALIERREISAPDFPTKAAPRSAPVKFIPVLFWKMGFAALVLALMTIAGLNVPQRFGTIRLMLLFSAGVCWWTLIEYCYHRLMVHGILQPGHSHSKMKPICIALPCRRYRMRQMLLMMSTLLPVVMGWYQMLLLTGLSFGWMWSVYMRAFIQWKGIHRFFPGLYRHYLYHSSGGVDKGFGICTTFWDRCFGSYVPEAHVHTVGHAA